MKYKTLIILAVGLAGIAALLFFVRPSRFLQPRFQPDPILQSALSGITEDYRRIIVLMDGSDSLDDATRARCLAAGRQIFWRKQRSLQEVGRKLAEHPNAGAVRQLIQYLSADPTLHDADKLAFLDLVEEVETEPSSAAPGAPRNPLTDQLQSLLANLQSIQLAYRE